MQIQKTDDRTSPYNVHYQPEKILRFCMIAVMLVLQRQLKSCGLISIKKN